MKLKGYQRYFLGVFLIVLGVSILLGGTVIYLTYRHTYAKEGSTYLRIIDHNASDAKHYLKGFEQEIRFLSEVPPIGGIIRARLAGGYDAEGHLSYEDWKGELKSIFASHESTHEKFIQLRYIDEKGQEIVRVNCEDDKCFLVPDDELQDKADRYYFKITMKLGPGQVYISAIDLNREHGKIEIPYKPTIRYAAPIFSEDGKRRGIVIANILAQELLHMDIGAERKRGMADFIIDQDGYYLHNSLDAKKEWGGEADLKTGISFKSDCPLCCKEVLSQQEGQFICKDDNQFMFFKRIQPNPNSNLFWVVMIRIPKNVLLAPVYISVGSEIAGLILMLMVVLLISRYVAGQIAIYEKIEEDSEKQKFETVVQKMGDGTIVCTPDWKINSINPSAQKYLNISNIKDINLLDLIYARYSPTIPKEQLSDTSKPRKAFDLIRKESKDFKALYLGAGLDILKDPNGEITNIVLTLRDITQERTEELLKQNFLSLISHKLKTPVTVIREDAAMLNEGVAGNLSDKQKKITSAILEKSYALSGLMERLFGFTTVTGGKLDLSKETVELKSYLPMLINPILSLAKEKKVELNIDCPDKDTKVDMNRVYFDLMIGELIENALKFNDKDAVKVDVGVKKVKEKVEISVSDNGRGIPPEEREKIFEKFYQIDKYFTGNIEGVGLGLSVVKRLVTACGGSIQLESEMGKGSKFTIIL